MGGANFGVYTEGLVTCIGIIVTGEGSSPTTETLHVLHVPAAEFMIESEWTKFKAGVEKAKLKNMKGTISIGDLSGAKPSVVPWDATVEALTKKWNDEMIKRLEALVGAANVSKKTHNMAKAEKGEGDEGILAADKTGKIYVNQKPPAQ